MVATITYPIAVRIARSRVFKLRNFYAIHVGIAPFLALVHVNIFAALLTFTKIKILESKKVVIYIKLFVGEYRENEHLLLNS
jgi:hypothetical protein